MFQSNEPLNFTRFNAKCFIFYFRFIKNPVVMKSARILVNQRNINLIINQPHLYNSFTRWHSISSFPLEILKAIEVVKQYDKETIFWVEFKLIFKSLTVYYYELITSKHFNCFFFQSILLRSILSIWFSLKWNMFVLLEPLENVCRTKFTDSLAYCHLFSLFWMNAFIHSVYSYFKIVYSIVSVNTAFYQ